MELQSNLNRLHAIAAIIHLEEAKPMVNEIELKLRIVKSDVPHLKRQLAAMDMRISKPKTLKVLSTYYDTSKLTLLNHGISLRLRRVSRKWIQTVKDTSKALSGLHQRMELENEVADGHLDFSKITDTAYSKLFNHAALRNHLAPIFSTDVQRTEWQLFFENRDQIKLVLDIGELVVGEKREPISEIELELKQGNTGRLFELALQLQQNIPLSIENISKAQRGYDYYRHRPPCIVMANPVKLRRKMSANDALKQIIQECLMQLQGNQDMVLYGKDIEGVHQMRIALRRLRSALNAFSCITSKRSSAKIVEELSWITNTLGNARDLDVFVTQTLPPLLQQLQNQPSLVLLAKKAKQKRLQAYAATRDALTSQRYQRLLIALEDWLENERWREEKTAKYNVYEVAQAILSKLHKQLKQSGKNLTQTEAEERHATRIAAKKLRYSAEFFADLYPSKITASFIKNLSQLQDQLGVMNDIDITNALLVKLLGQRPNRNLAVTQYLFYGWNAHKLIHCIKLMNTSWQKFCAQKPFW